MKQFNDKTIILEGNIVNLIPSYVEEFKPGYDKGFNLFSDEVILYALLEYSRFSRPYSKVERIKYIYDKCVSFSGVGLLPNEYRIELESEYDDNSWYIYNLLTNRLPF